MTLKFALVGCGLLAVNDLRRSDKNRGAKDDVSFLACCRIFGQEYF